ncbi:hypothetical protein B7463_g6005, partial [Scytalidium lignicola]
MVGVPGRSKACHTCRQRRIACGLERPQCSQCVKSNRVCAGYQRERVFILNHESTEQALKSHAQAQSQILGNHARNGPGTGKTKGASEKAEECVPAKSREKTPPSSPQLLGQIVPHAVFRQQLLNEFLYNHVHEDFRRGHPDDGMTPWFMLLVDQPLMTKALEGSILAVCTARIGRIHNDTALINESLKLYGLGLRELQKALWNPKLMYDDETLAACMALSTYEVMECPGGTHQGWLSHHNGLERLIKLRGAEAHAEGLGHKIFLIFRTTSSMDHKRISYLLDPKWIEIPWKKFPKLPYDRLIDILAEGTTIMAETAYYDDLCPVHLLQSSLNLIDRCWKLDFQLQEFYDELERMNSGPLFWAQPCKNDNPSDDSEASKLFPLSFYFCNLMVANTCMVYWTLCLILYSGMVALYSVMHQLSQLNLDIESFDPSAHPSPRCAVCTHSVAPASTPSPPFLKTTDPAQLPPLLHRSDFAATARNICQSVEYFMQEEMLVQGPAMTVMPLSVVIATAKEYPHLEKEIIWARGILDKVHERGLRRTPSEVSILILGAGWTSTFLIPLLESRGITYAATTTGGRDGTLKFKFDDNDKSNAQFAALPKAKTILITFPLTGKDQSRHLVTSYSATHSNAHAGSDDTDSAFQFIQLGSTGIWQTPEQETWVTRHSRYDTTNARAIAEDELLELGGCVLDLAGLWGGKRQPKDWLERVVKSKEGLKEKGSLHLVHGMDVARAVVAVHGEFATERWMLTDLFVYDWWSLALGWAGQRDSAEEERNDQNQILRWVQELMIEEDMKALPRPMERLGRCYDTREFWNRFGIVPINARI